MGKFFSAIKNGAWHGIDELANELDIPTSKLIEFSDFLSSHGLLKYENETNRIRIESRWKLLLPEEEKPTELKTTLATFIIPPDTSIEVQSTQITNLSKVELEVNLRMDNKIREVAIKI